MKKWGWKDGLVTKSWPCKHQDVSLNPLHPHKSWVLLQVPETLVFGVWVETGRYQLTNQLA